MSQLKHYLTPYLTVHGGIAALTMEDGGGDDHTPSDPDGCESAPGKIDGELHDACHKQSKS